MAELWYLIRLIHALAGIGWFGEVLTVSVVLVPALARASAADRVWLLALVMPRLFRLATVLGGTTLGSGLILVSWATQGHPVLLAQSAWGHRVLSGAVVGGALYAFHLLQEPSLERIVGRRLQRVGQEPEDMARLPWRLIWVPRIGTAILAVVIGLMAAAGHLP
jgi:uncharacterized membrane protein